MSKDSLSARKGQRAAQPEPTLAEEESAEEQPAGKQTSSDLSQTEAFTMAPGAEDNAADFLLGSDEEGEANDLGDTDMAPAPVAAKQPQQTSKPKEAKPSPAAAKANLEETVVVRERPAAATHKGKEPDKTEVAADSASETPSAPAQQNAPKATVLGDYRLAKRIGQGGMGSVYKAQKISLDREVAVKVLAKELSSKPAFVQRFLREARVMAKLDHPNILRCFDVGEAQGYHYLAMEFVDGGSVEGWLKKVGRFSLGDALYIVLTTASALQHAHEQGTIHRDIKPDNILLTSKGVIKVADLGLAKATDDDLGLTKTGTGAGTPFYMAPEQARDVKHVDKRVDIYALGVMTYVFLTGEMPFQGETLVEVIEAKEKGKFASVRKFNDEVPEKLELVLGKMMAAKPEHRYGTCAEVIADLEAFELAHDRLSFIAAPAGVKAAPARKPAVQTALPKGKTTEKPTSAPARGKTQSHVGEAMPDSWFWAFENDEGQRVVKKLTKDKIITLIRSGSIDTDAQISHSSKAGFRSVATFGEFLPYLQKNIITEKVVKKGDKYRDMYKQIEEEEKSRIRWRWFHNLYIKLGGGIGFLLWMCIVIALVIGGYFGARWLLEFLGNTVADKAGLK